MKIYCVTWKDERWSADKETLKAINKMISKNIKTKSSFLSPETVLLYFMYCIGFVYHNFMSFVKWVIKK
tara:strand:- start:9713 stop:9919 length:207 start_codon:yes stop_codon:yes gene_type:complete